MGYETRLVIGRAMDPMGSEEQSETGGYFLKDVMFDFGKIGTEHALGNLHSKAVNEVKEGKSSVYKKVYWSDTFDVRQEKVLETLKKEDENLLLGLGGEEKAEEIIEVLSKYAESWETQRGEDPYGDPFVAIPLKEVYHAMINTQAWALENWGEPHFKIEASIATLSAFAKLDYSDKFSCIIYGY